LAVLSAQGARQSDISLGEDALVVLRIRMTVAPWLTAINGADDEANEFVMLYSDVRGVARRYDVNLTAQLEILASSARLSSAIHCSSCSKWRSMQVK
jgi:hypothetical protein